MIANIEQTVLRNLLVNEPYMRKVLPFIKPEYFEGVYQKLFKEVAKYVAKYNRLPTAESFKIELDDSNLTEEQYRHAVEIIPEIFKKEEVDDEWLYDKTEKWCQDRALYNAVMESINIIDGKHATLTKNALPDILTKALGVSFDTNIGHDYIEDVESRSNSITTKKNVSHSIYIYSMRSLKMVYRIRHSTLLWLVLALVSLCLCVTSLQVYYHSVRMFFILPWRWQKNVLLNVSTLIY